jgi:tetratricopeptide (TPR) repeat protein
MIDTLTGKQLAAEAGKAYKQGDFTSAGHSYDAAAQSYEAAGDEVSSAEMRNNASVSFLMGGDAMAALTAVQGTIEIFARHGDVRRQGMAFGNLASVFEALNRIEEAKLAYQQSSDLLRQAGEMELRMHAVKALSALQLKSGQQLVALSTMQDGLAEVKHPSPRERLLKKILSIPANLRKGSL